MITIVNGNLLDAKEVIIAHQVNCMGVMGSGVAKQLRNKYPKLYIEYKEYCNRFYKPSDLLGTICYHSVFINKRYIANLFGQLFYGTDKQYTDYAALEKCFKTLASVAKEHNFDVAMPYNIGCKLAGGDWNIVYKLIEDAFKDINVTLYKYGG